MLNNSTTETISPKKSQPFQSLPITNHQINKNNFSFCYIIGKGGFGKVWKVQYKKTKEIFALKEMSKLKVLDKKSEQSINSERLFLSFLNHPFIVNMHYAFQDNENLYLVIDMLSGGDLRYHISRYRRFSEEQTRFFIACMVHSIDYIHKNNVIHRDMKPENLVLDDKGYVRITDFGIAKENCKDNSSETSGTPGYMSPEVMNGKHHSFEADYFAIGVIGYEFMTGRRPYYGKNRKEIKEQMLSKQAIIKNEVLPHGWSEESMDFVNKLLLRKSEERLGVNGANELMEHPWLRYYPWKELEKKRLNAPFIPEKKDNFDKRYCELVDNITQETRIRYDEIFYKEKFKKAFIKFYYNKDEIKIMPVQKIQMIQVMQKQIDQHYNQQGLNTTRETSHVQSITSNYNSNKSTTTREAGTGGILKDKDKEKEKDNITHMMISISQKKINDIDISNNNDMNNIHYHKNNNKNCININNYIQKKYIQILHKHQKNNSHNNSLNLSCRYQPIPYSTNKINNNLHHSKSPLRKSISNTGRDSHSPIIKDKDPGHQIHKQDHHQKNQSSSFSSSIKKTKAKTNIINHLIANSSNYFTHIKSNKIKYEAIPKKCYIRASSGFERREHQKSVLNNSNYNNNSNNANSRGIRNFVSSKEKESNISINIYKQLSRVNSMNKMPSRYEKDILYNQMKSSVSAMNSSKKLNYVK